MLKKLLFTLVAITTASALFAQVNVSGTVFKTDDKGVKEPLPFVNVFLIGSEGTGASTDFDGKFTLKLKEGKHQLKFSSVDTDSRIVNIEVSKGMKPLEIEMGTKKNVLGDVVVTGTKIGGPTEEKVVEDVKNSEGVVVKKRKEDIENTGEKDVKGAVKTMAGISSATSNSMVFIRGLGDRYNMAYLNGLPMPSPNTELRMIDLGMFPTSIISTVEVNKVLDASYFGDYAGGMINIETSQYFKRPTLNISLSSGVNTNTSFRDFRTYNGGKLDYLGIDNQARQIPDNVLSSAKQNATQYVPNGFYKSVEGSGDGFENNFSTRLIKALPSLSFKIEGGNFWSFAKEVNGKRDKYSKGIGILALVKHGTSFNRQIGSTKIVNAQSEDRLNYDVNKYTFNTSTSGMFNLHYQIAKKHSVSYNFLYINTSSDETKETWGTHFDYEDNGDVYARRLTFKQNNIYLNQLKGNHKFLEKDRYQINWALSYGITNSQEPDRRQLVYQYDPADRNNFDQYNMFSLDKNQNHRFFSDLRENELAFRLDNKVDLVYRTVYKKDEKGQVKDSSRVSMFDMDFGFSLKRKFRNFSYRQFNYDLAPMANDVNGMALPIDAYDPDFYISDDRHDIGLYNVQEVQNPANWYDASLNIYGGYLSFNIKPVQNFEIIPAIRLEYGDQSVKNRNQQQPFKTDISIIKGLEYMPSLAMKYTLKEKHVFRLVGSKTITRPKFSEVAPFQYIADFAGITAEGNPDLQNGTNYNADFRYEWYPGKADMISLGGFYKYLQNPIEKTMIATASGQLQSYGNALTAQVAGVELEVSKNLGFFSKKDTSEWKNFAIAFNLAYMYSSVEINKTASTINTNSERPLEGASPFLANVSLKYEKRFGGERKNKHKITTALSYNVFGRRLFAVGSNGIGDQYELPVNMLNFVFKAELDRRFGIGLNLNNILNASYRIVQENRVNEGEWLDINTYKRGVDISVSLSYKILAPKRKKDKEPKDL